MARGALIKDGVVVEIFEAASDYDPNYGGEGVAFVPSAIAQVGDAWDGKIFTGEQTDLLAVSAQVASISSSVDADPMKTYQQLIAIRDAITAKIDAFVAALAAGKGAGEVSPAEPPVVLAP